MIWIAVLHSSAPLLFSASAVHSFSFVYLLFVSIFFSTSIFHFDLMTASVIARRGRWFWFSAFAFIFAAVSVHLSPIIVCWHNDRVRNYSCGFLFCFLFESIQWINEIAAAANEKRVHLIVIIIAVLNTRMQIGVVLRRNVWSESWKCGEMGRTNENPFVCSTKTN